MCIETRLKMAAVILLVVGGQADTQGRQQLRKTQRNRAALSSPSDDAEAGI